MQCSEVCGGGEQQRIVTCPEENGCDRDLQPSNIQACNSQPCAQWLTGSWGEVRTPNILKSRPFVDLLNKNIILMYIPTYKKKIFPMFFSFFFLRLYYNFQKDCLTKLTSNQFSVFKVMCLFKESVHVVN